MGKDLFDKSVDLDQIKTIDHSEKYKGRSKSTVKGDFKSPKKNLNEKQRYGIIRSEKSPSNNYGRKPTRTIDTVKRHSHNPKQIFS